VSIILAFCTALCIYFSVFHDQQILANIGTANIKMDVKVLECGGVDWIQLDKGSVQWWDVVNTVMNYRVHKTWGISWSAK
jgi:hypothetical protein